jgi:MFS family permease
MPGDRGTITAPGRVEPARTRGRPGRRAFLAVAATFAVMYMANNVPTPLYPRYQHAWGFGTGMVTVVFAIYVGGVLAALFLLGRLSDLRGRRPVLLGAVALMAAAVALLLGARAPGWLLGPRVLQGLAVGAFTGTATAAMAELEPHGDGHRAGLFTTAATAVGIALGTLTAGAMAQYLPWPLRLVYGFMLALLLVCALALTGMPETVRPRTDVPMRAALRPTVPRVGPGTRARFTIAALSGFCAFAVVGLFSALAPTMLTELLHQPNSAVSGAVVAAVFAASTLAQLGGARRRAVPTTSTGLCCVAAGLGVLTGALAAGSGVLLATGGVIAGAGNGLALSGGLRMLAGLVPPERRGQLSSTFWLVSYLGMALPTLGLGLAADSFGLLPATIAFAVVIGGLALAVVPCCLVAAARAAAT